MYKYRPTQKGLISLRNDAIGEDIETKVKRLIHDKEPIKDAAPLIFTDRSEGVNAAYNIRTDRWEIATEAMDRITAMKTAKSEDLRKAAEAEKAKIEVGKPEPTPGKTSGESTT